MSYAIAHARHVVADGRASCLDERSEFVAAEQISIAIDLGEMASLEILAQAVVMATARSVRILEGFV